MRTWGSSLTAATLAAMLATGIGSAAAQSMDGPAQRVIVKFKNGSKLMDPAAGAATALTDAGARSGVAIRSLRTLGGGGELVRLERRLERGELDSLIATLRADPEVEYAEEDILLQTMAVPNDPLYSLQWNYFEAAGGLNLPAAWDLSSGAGIRVAVLDTGIRPHPDLVGNLLGGYDFISDVFIANDGGGRDADAKDPGNFAAANACGPGSPAINSSWHGTHVAGTVGAVTNNGVGVAGVAFGSKIVPVRVIGRCGGSLSDIADAVVWASGGAVAGVPTNPYPARVINMSLGYPMPCSPTAQSAIDSARSRGTVLVVAAGNDNTNVSTFTPANCAGVIAVAATNRSGGKAPYSNFGAQIDVAAPGGALDSSAANGVLSTINTGASAPVSDSNKFYEGTSMATPHVAGVAALMLARNGNLTPDNVESILKSTARAFPAACSQCGAGIVRADAAVRASTALRANAGSDRYFSPYFVGMIDACRSSGNIVSYTFTQVSYQSLYYPGALSAVSYPVIFQPVVGTTQVQSLATPYTTSRCLILVNGYETNDVLTVRVTVRDAAGNTSSDTVSLRGAVLFSPEFYAVEREIQANQGRF